MDFSRKVNYKSDFDVLLHVVDANDNAVGYPDFDFTLLFSTNGQKTVEVGQANGVTRGVSDADGDIRVIFNDHGLMPGVLNLEVRANVENDIYPDGKKLTVFSVQTNITLGSDNGDGSSGLLIDVKLPFVYVETSSSSS